jgi:hypothetical protein
MASVRCALFVAWLSALALGLEIASPTSFEATVLSNDPGTLVFGAAVGA